MPLRLVFMGTAELACASLRALLADNQFQVVGVVTQPDRPKGRDLKLQASPVKKIAVAAGLPVLQPERARDPQFLDALTALQPDLLVVAAYGQILPPALLEMPKFGAVNVHASLLPKYRGAAPIQWAILNDDAETGVTIMQMAAGLDTGDMLSRQSTPILPEDTAATLHDRLADLGARLLVKTIIDYTAGRITPEPQLESASTYARKITKEDGRLHWERPARALWNQVRAFTPWPGAFTFLPGAKGSRLLKIIRAQVEPAARGTPGEVVHADASGVVTACGEGGLRVEELQLEGGRRMRAGEFLAGRALSTGTKLG
jgi:methionyl-tRNA formyltransferase